MTADLRAEFRARVLAAARLSQARVVALAGDVPVDPREQVESLITKGGAALGVLAVQLLTNKIGRQAFVEEATALLTKTVTTGALHGGGISNEDAAAIATEIVGKQREYLDRFARELDAAQPASETMAATGMTEAQAAARAAQYAGTAWPGYQMGRLQAHVNTVTEGASGKKAKKAKKALTDGVTIIWECLDDGASCDDCPDLADKGPYTVNSLPTFPGLDVQCGGSCRCHLQFGSGNRV